MSKRQSTSRPARFSIGSDVVRRLVIVLVAGALAALLAGAMVPASALAPLRAAANVFEASTYVYVVAAHSAHAQPSEGAPAASHDVSESAQGTAATTSGPLSGLWPFSAAADSGMTSVFRAVGPDEAASIDAAKAYTPGPGNIGKYFYPTEAQAESLAAKYSELGIGGPYTITTGRVPSAVLDGVDSIHPAGEGPAWFFGNDQLPSICDVVCIGGAS